MIAPTPPPTDPPMIAARFDGDEEDDPDAFDAFEGSKPVEDEAAIEEDEASDEVCEDEVTSDELLVEVEVGVVEVVVLVLDVVVDEVVVDEVVVELVVVEEVVVDEDGVGGTGQLLMMVETGTDVTTRLVSVTVKASVVVLPQI